MQAGRFRKLILLAAFAGTGIIKPASAQDSDVFDLDLEQLEEMLVVARRVTEHIQEVPISMTAFSSKELENRNLDELAGLQGNVPNLVFSSGSSGSSEGTNMSIRGIGQPDFLNTSEPSVGLYIDGVIMSRTLGSMNDLVDVERIEVLKGPQGILYGKNTIGGSINVITKEPDLEEFALSVAGEAGSRSMFHGRLMVNAPLVQNELAVRVNFATLNQDGFGDFLDTGAEMGDEDALAASVDLRWAPNDDIDLRLKFDWTERRQQPSQSNLVDFVPNDTVDFYAAITGQVINRDTVGITEPFDTFANFQAFDDLDVWGVSATLEWALSPSATLKSITAFRSSDWSGGVDTGGTRFEIVEQFLQNEIDIFTQEIQLIGTAMDERLNWLVAGFFAAEETTYGAQAVILGGAFELIGLDFDIDQESLQDITSIAVFGQASYHFTDRLTLTLGGRFTNDDKDFTAELFNPSSGNVVIPRGSEKASFSFFNPMGVIRYQVNDNVMTYFTVVTGARSGGFNGRAQTETAGFVSFDEETVRSHEIGIKTDLLGNRLQINAAAFYNDYEDIQLTAFSIDPSIGATFDTVVTNAAKAKIYGGELQLVALPHPNVRFDLGIGLTENEFKDVDPRAVANGVSEDNELPLAPKWTVNAGVQFSFDVNWGGMAGELFARAQYARTSSRYSFAENNLKLEAFNTLGARISYAPRDAIWQVALFGNNLTNEKYKDFGLGLQDSVGTVVAWHGEKREIGVALRLDF